MTLDRKTKIYSEKEHITEDRSQELMISLYADSAFDGLQNIASIHHVYYQVIFVQQGSGTHRIDFVDYSFKGPCLFLLHPQNIHNINQDNLTSGGVIKFSSSLFANIKMGIGAANFLDVFDDTDIMPVINLSPDQSFEIEKLFNDLHRESNHNSVITPQLLVLYLKIFLLKIFSIKKNDVCSDLLLGPDILRFRSFQDLVEKDFRQYHVTSHYTNQLNLSLRTLGNIACRVGGPPPSELIKQRILLEAKRLLNSGGQSVKEISYTLGFENSSYFTRFFRLNTGLTPLQFRKRY
jgi:AraC family transcriptional activator of pobA